MSAGTLRTRVLARIAALRCPRQLNEELTRVVDKCDSMVLHFLFQAGIDSGQPCHTTIDRAVVACLEYLSIQLSDDLSDDDCAHLVDARREGPLLLMLLQTAFFEAALEAELPVEPLQEAIRLLRRVGSGQYAELTMDRASIDGALHVARELNGAQHAAYLLLMWAGTRLERDAKAVGMDLGVAVHVATDMTTGDPRFWALQDADQRSLIRHARSALVRASRYGLSCVDLVRRGAGPVLVDPSSATGRRRIAPRWGERTRGITR